jgi:nucleoside-diphosphate-sugar epimerase
MALIFTKGRLPTIEGQHYLIFIVPHLQALRKQPMTVYGDGKQTRSFQYVSDLVLDLLTSALLLYENCIDAAFIQIWNL